MSSSLSEIEIATSSISGERGKRKEWDEDEKLVKREEQRQEKLRHLQKEAFMLANYYFVFQGVIFTAIYGAPSELKCRYRWFPVTLSSLAGSINFFAILEIAWKYNTTMDAADRNDRKFISVECPRRWRWFCFAACIFAFLAFLVVTVVACWFISCAKDSSSRVPPPARSPA